jgi:nucleoside-diphosphate-sugar epimerase
MSQAAAATRLTCKRNAERRDVNSVHVFVAGASGVLGRRLVPQLTARGHRVTATTTRSDRLGSKNWAADGVVLDGLDGAMVGEAVAQGRAVQALAAA